MNRRQDAKLRRRAIRHVFRPRLGTPIGWRCSSSATFRERGSEKSLVHPGYRDGSINPSGATIGFADSDLYGKSPEDINRTFDLMRQTGVSTVRIMVPWALIQPTPDQWDWGVVDTMVNSALAHDISVLAALNSTPGWAGPSQPPGLQCQPGRSSLR